MSFDATTAIFTSSGNLVMVPSNTLYTPLSTIPQRMRFSWRQGTRHKVSAHGIAQKRNAIRIHLRLSQGKIHHRSDDLFPIVTKRKFLLLDHPALTGTFKNKAVVARA